MEELLSPEKIEPIILKLCSEDPKYINVINSVYKISWMSDEFVGKMISVIIKYYEQKSKLPSHKTLDLLISKIYPETYQETSIKLKRILGINTQEYDSQYLDEEVLKYFIGCGLYISLADSMDDLHKRSIAAEIVEKMRKIVSLNFDIDLGLDYLEDINQHCEELMNPERRVSTGWDSIDSAMGGGMYRDGRCLILFLGQTHIGKSLILSNMASNMLRNDKFVIIITCEMSKLVYATRIDAHLTLGNINKIHEHTDKIKQVASNIKENYPKAKLLIKDYPPDSVNCNHIRSYIEEAVQHYGRNPDAILIDYLGLLVPNQNKGSESFEKYKDVSTQMRALSYVFSCPVVSVIQSNRSGADNTELGLTHTAESYAIPQTADFIGSLYQREGEREAELINVEILKNRLGGQIGKHIQFHISYTNLKISDIQTSNAPTNQVVDDLLGDINETLEDL